MPLWKEKEHFYIDINSEVLYKTSPEVVTQQPLIQLHVTTMQFVPQEYVGTISDAIVKIIHIYCFKDLKHVPLLVAYLRMVSIAQIIQMVRW